MNYIQVRAARRLKADVESTAVTRSVEHLKTVMGLCLGSSMKIRMVHDGPRTLIAFSGSSPEYDLSSTDLNRIQRAIYDTHAVMTISVESGRPVFIFEIEPKLPRVREPSKN